MVAYSNRMFAVYYGDKSASRGGNRRGHGKGGLAPLQVIGYVRVSTEEQQRSGAGLAAQRKAIEAECARRGWQLVEVIEDAGYSAWDLKLPGVQIALETLRRGEAGALVVAKLDRLSRSMLDLPCSCSGSSHRISLLASQRPSDCKGVQRLF